MKIISFFKQTIELSFIIFTNYNFGRRKIDRFVLPFVTQKFPIKGTKRRDISRPVDFTLIFLFQITRSTVNHASLLISTFPPIVVEDARIKVNRYPILDKAPLPSSDFNSTLLHDGRVVQRLVAPSEYQPFEIFPHSIFHRINPKMMNLPLQFSLPSLPYLNFIFSRTKKKFTILPSFLPSLIHVKIVIKLKLRKLRGNVKRGGNKGIHPLNPSKQRTCCTMDAYFATGETRSA